MSYTSNLRRFVKTHRKRIKHAKILRFREKLEEVPILKAEYKYRASRIEKTISKNQEKYKSALKVLKSKGLKI